MNKIKFVTCNRRVEPIARHCKHSEFLECTFVQHALSRQKHPKKPHGLRNTLCFENTKTSHCWIRTRDPDLIDTMDFLQVLEEFHCKGVHLRLPTTLWMCGPNLTRDPSREPCLGQYLALRALQQTVWAIVVRNPAPSLPVKLH